MDNAFIAKPYTLINSYRLKQPLLILLTVYNYISSIDFVCIQSVLVLYI